MITGKFSIANCLSISLTFVQKFDNFDKFSTPKSYKLYTIESRNVLVKIEKYFSRFLFPFFFFFCFIIRSVCLLDESSSAFSVRLLYVRKAKKKEKNLKRKAKTSSSSCCWTIREKKKHSENDTFY